MPEKGWMDELKIPGNRFQMKEVKLNKWEQKGAGSRNTSVLTGLKVPLFRTVVWPYNFLLFCPVLKKLERKDVQQTLISIVPNTCSFPSFHSLIPHLKTNERCSCGKPRRGWIEHSKITNCQKRNQEINKGCERNLQSQEVNSQFSRDVSAEPLSVLRVNLQ